MVKTDCKNVIKTLASIQNVQIPRKIINKNQVIKTIELQGVSDASYQAYGACVYIQVIYESGKNSIKLVSAKSRVAPLKTTSIPRLELLGNLILSRLMNTMKNALKNDIKISNCFYWSDSMVSLSWIKA